jgi:Na+-transporting methylmalonyl-CoA/oxaloacetate decarboxylase gamma subunit
MFLATLGVVFVFVVTLIGAVLFLRIIRRVTGEPADPDTERAAAAITTSSAPPGP